MTFALHKRFPIQCTQTSSRFRCGHLDLSKSVVFKIYFDLTQFDLNQRAMLVTNSTALRQRGLAFMTDFRAAF